MDMSDNTAPAEGGKKIIILCEKVSKEDIKVRFFDYNGWEEWADLGPAGVHKQYAISLTAPRYSDPGITEAVRVGVELGVRDRAVLCNPAQERAGASGGGGQCDGAGAGRRPGPGDL